MSAPICIMRVGELPQASWCPPFGVLDRLREKGLITLLDITQVPFPVREFDVRGILCRPSKGGHLHVQDFDGPPNHPLVIGSLSKDISHIKLPPEYVAEIIHAHGNENAAAVADHTITLASEILRPVGESATTMASAGWESGIDSIAHQLDGLAWGCVGAGDQVRLLIPQLIARRCKEIVVFHPVMSKARFQKILECLQMKSLTDKIGDEDLKFSLINPLDEIVTIRGVGGLLPTDFYQFLRGVDIISLHVPPQSQQDIDQLKRNGTKLKYEWITTNLIRSETIEKMKKTVRIINVSRGSLVNETDVVTALDGGRIAGFAADVIDATAEMDRDSSQSPLWNAFHHLEKDRRNGCLRAQRLYLTPHVGGATVQSLTAVALGVLPNFLRALHIDVSEV